MMAARSSQVISSNGEIPGRVKWREKESPVARAGAARKGAAAPALLAVCIPERLFTGVGFEVCIGFIGGDSPSSILFCRSYRSILCCRLARDLQSCVVSRFRLPLQLLLRRRRVLANADLAFPSHSIRNAVLRVPQEPLP